MPLEQLIPGELGTPESTAKLNAVVDAVNAGGVGGALDTRVGDLEEVVGDAEAGLVHDVAGKYALPEGGIPATDLDADVQASLSRAQTALLGSATLTAIRFGKVALNGSNPTPVAFTQDARAEILGEVEAETFALAHEDTLIVNPDGDGDDTVTFEAAAGTSTSGATPSTDISGGVDNKFAISVDGDEPETVELTLAGLDSGAAIATAMQNAIQALTGNKTGVTVAYAEGVYVITSPTKGTGSAVVITNAADHNVAEELKLGVGNGGVEAAGTGDAANIAAATAQEIAAAITAKATGWAAEAVGNRVRIYSPTVGSPSSLIVNATSTTDAKLGISGAAYGPTGLGYETDMADANYLVVATLEGVEAASLADKGLSVVDKSASGFGLVCETAAATDNVAFAVFGQAA